MKQNLVARIAARFRLRPDRVAPGARRGSADRGGLHRRFRFGVTVDRVFAGSDWGTFCRQVEDLGFSTLVIPDHLGDQLSPFPALAAAAEATSVLRLGSLVACNDFRHPVMHARDLATIDVLSDGRAEWGVGAGWLEDEYSAAGFRFDRPPTRVDRLQEAVLLMKQLFGDEPVQHRGQHYQVNDLTGRPRPVQHPHPPLLIGGAGRRLLSFSAHEADTIGIAPSLSTRRIGTLPPRETVEQGVDRQLGWIRDAAGQRFQDVELNMVVYPAVITDSPADRAVEWADFLGLDVRQVLASPHVWCGSVADICERVVERRERWGVSYWVVPATAVEAVAPVVARLAGS